MVMKTQEECKRLAVKDLERKQNRGSNAQAFPKPSKGAFHFQYSASKLVIHIYIINDDMTIDSTDFHQHDGSQ